MSFCAVKTFEELLDALSNAQLFKKEFAVWGYLYT
jgi:hypothetical protein